MLPSYRRAQGTDKKETGKISTAVAKQNRNFPPTETAIEALALSTKTAGYGTTVTQIRPQQLHTAPNG
jgi:hypothetical protein